MNDAYGLPAAYRPRLQPEYFLDTSEEVVWQPNLYADAADLAHQLGAHTIIDLGCGSGAKLRPLFDDFSVIGVDYGPNIEKFRAAYPEAQWLEQDLDAPDGFRIDRADSLLVCGDVVEHLVHPERLLATIDEALARGAAAVLFTTPDRELHWGPDHLGPPPNACHAREWTREEFRRLLELQGWTPHVGLTRSNSAEPRAKTIFAAVAGPGREEALATWWRKRNKWQVVVAHDEETLSKLEREVADQTLRLERVESQLEQRERELEHLKSDLEQVERERSRDLEALTVARAQEAALADTLRLMNRSRWVRMGRRLGSRMPPVSPPQPSAPAQRRPTSFGGTLKSMLRGGQILATEGPDAFAQRYREWSAARSSDRGADGVAPATSGENVILLGVAETDAVPPDLDKEHLPDDGARPEISIVIVVWNALEYARECVRSVAHAKSRRSFEILVIDNGSDIDVLRWLNEERHKTPELRFLRLPANVGFARGSNLGARLARGRYLILLNSDTLVTDGWSDALADALEMDDSLGVVSPVTNYVGEGLQIDEAARNLSPDEAQAYARTIRERTDVHYPPERMAFFCAAMNRELFERLNGLDEGFGIGNFEDEDFCLRTTLLGQRLGVIRNSFVYHHGSKTFEENNLHHGFWMHRNIERYLEKLSRVSAERPMLPRPRSAGKAPTVSVIVRTRNRPESLAVALNSLAWQTFRDFEVVVVNDGGEDVSLLLSEYEPHLSIQYVRNETSHGQAGALNDGLHAVRGGFVGYLDDDDLVYPYHLAALVNAIQEPGAGHFVYSHYHRALVLGEGRGARVVERCRLPLWSFNRDELLVRNFPAQHTWLHTRACAERAGGFDTAYSVLQDWDFLLRVTEQFSPVPVPRETCEYRIYADLRNSMSTGRATALADLNRIYDTHPVSSAHARKARAREIDALQKQVESVAELEQSVALGRMEREEATRSLLAATFGFAAEI